MNSSCTSAHSGKLFLREKFPFEIDQLYTMIFTNSRFSQQLQTALETINLVQSPWQLQAGVKCRRLSYTIKVTSGLTGSTEIHVTERQVMNKCSKPGQLYSIDCTSDNAGIPYADYFSVAVHYCLQRVADGVTDLALYGHVHYKKSIWGIIENLIESNAISALEYFCCTLKTQLAEARCADERDVSLAATQTGLRRLGGVSAASSLMTMEIDAEKSPRSIKTGVVHFIVPLFNLFLLLLFAYFLFDWILGYIRRGFY